MSNQEKKKAQVIPVDLTDQEKAAWQTMDRVRQAKKKIKEFTPSEYEAYLIIERYKANKRKLQANARLVAIKAKERKADTHAKVLLGSVLLAWIKKEQGMADQTKKAIASAKKVGVEISDNDMQAITVAIEAAELERENLAKAEIERKRKEAEKAAREGEKTAKENQQADNADKQDQAAISPENAELNNRVKPQAAMPGKSRVDNAAQSVQAVSKHVKIPEIRITGGKIHAVKQTSQQTANQGQTSTRPVNPHPAQTKVMPQQAQYMERVQAMSFED